MDNNEAYSVLRSPESNDALIIFNRVSGIKVRVVRTDQHNPEFKDTEVHFFGDMDGSPLAFETIGYNDQGIDLVKDAIRWYSEYCGFPGMEIKNIEFNL